MQQAMEANRPHFDTLYGKFGALQRETKEAKEISSRAGAYDSKLDSVKLRVTALERGERAPGTRVHAKVAEARRVTHEPDPAKNHQNHSPGSAQSSWEVLSSGPKETRLQMLSWRKRFQED